MVLSSQAQRRGVGGNAGGGYVSTFRQKRRRRMRNAAIALGAVVGLYLVYSMWPEGEPTPGTPSAADASIADSRTDDSASNRTASPAPAAAGLPTAPRPLTPKPAETPKPAPAAVAPTPAPTPSPAAAPKPAVAQAPKGDVAPAPRPAAAPAPAPAPAPTSLASTRTSSDVRRNIDAARQMIANDQLVDARKMLSKALRGEISPADADTVREDLRAINDTLVFSARVVANDPAAEAHVIQQGEFLVKIAQKYDVPWTFIARINDNLNPARIRVGQRIKVVRGPFHVVVDKSDFRLDAYLGDPASPDSLFIRSFPVGLGADDSTPLGRFVVRRHSKLANPEWTNPRTGERFHADNPRNPLGEYWIGLDGIDDATRTLGGYGIHGTIEPDSIGRQASMGCVRLRDADIELLFHMLEESQTTVTIVP